MNFPRFLEAHGQPPEKAPILEAKLHYAWERSFNLQSCMDNLLTGCTDVKEAYLIGFAFAVALHESSGDTTFETSGNLAGEEEQTLES
jgi:hypothetical protein